MSPANDSDCDCNGVLIAFRKFFRFLFIVISKNVALRSLGFFSRIRKCLVRFLSTQLSLVSYRIARISCGLCETRVLWIWHAGRILMLALQMFNFILKNAYFKFTTYSSTYRLFESNRTAVQLKTRTSGYRFDCQDSWHFFEISIEIVTLASNVEILFWNVSCTFRINLSFKSWIFNNLSHKAALLKLLRNSNLDLRTALV